MSLQPGINPLEAASMDEDRKRLERTMAARKFRQGIEDRTNLYNEMKKRTGPAVAAQMQANTKDRPVGVTGQRMENMGGFDPSDLMARPEIRQQETRNQANMVSAPYEEANRMAAEKTNPMNAESQNPGKPFLMQYIGK